MSFIYLKENITYLGCNSVQISKREKKQSFFYRVSLEDPIKEKLYIKRVTKRNKDLLYIDKSIKNEDYFFIYDDKFEDYAIIATIEGPLLISDKKLEGNKKRLVDAEFIDKFSLYLTYYYTLNENIEEGKYFAAYLGNLKIYTLLNSLKKVQDKREIIEYLQHLINEEESYERITIREYVDSEEPLCLVELLEEIIENKDSKLLWDFNYLYNRITESTVLVEDDYKFIKEDKGYGEVTRIAIGDKKLNIGLKVKVYGQVLNNRNNLKLDSYIYREYNIVMDGKYNVKYLFCKLSEILQKKYKKLKLIKGIKTIFGEDIVALDISQLNIINKRVIKGIDQGVLVDALYKSMQLNSRMHVVKAMIKDIPYIGLENEGKLDEKERVRKEYRVDVKGLYAPLKVKRVQKEKIGEIYFSRIIQYKIDKFPSKKEEESWIEYYSIYKEKKIEVAYRELIEEYSLLKREREYVDYLVNLIRLYYGIKKEEYLLFETTEEKEKKEIDKLLGTNKVLDKKAIIKKKTINNIVLKQESYVIINVL